MNKPFLRDGKMIFFFFFFFFFFFGVLGGILFHALFNCHSRR